MKAFLFTDGGTIVGNGSAGKDPPPSDLHSETNGESSSAPHSELVLPTFKPSCSTTPIYYRSPPKSYSYYSDCHSLTSQDSGIPTLEVNPPDPILHSHLQSGDGRLMLDASRDSPATLPLDDNPSDSNVVHKSSTFPRSGYDSVRLFSTNLRLPPAAGLGVASGALNRSDDISVCSVSSMSTELSVSNEDILDFTVTSDSSAVVTFEADHSGSAHFSDVTLSSSPGDSWSPGRFHPELGIDQQEDGRLKKLGPLASLFNR